MRAHNSSMYKTINLLAALALVVAAGACGSKSDQGGDQAAVGAGSEAAVAAGGDTIRIDGSSTVFPITQAVAEEYQAKHGGRVTIGVSGTGGGFKKFCRGETSVTGASRPVKQSEREACKQAGIDFVELPVAYDGIAVVVHPDNKFVDQLTIEELEKIWAPESQGKITKWNQIRSDWPNEEIHLFGPGVDSGTYDYFTEAIVGNEGASRGDFTSSEDDNVLVQGVSTDPHALGFFGFAYYVENKDKLRLIGINDGDDSNGAGAIQPTLETVANGTYQPLSRPLFIYVSSKSFDRPEVKQFVDFYLAQGRPLVQEVGYIPLPDTAYTLVEKRFDDKTTGSLFEGGSKVGATVEQLLQGS